MKSILFIFQTIFGQEWQEYRLPDNLLPIHYDIDLKFRW